ncbi:unnamed protein product [Prorocentrum cordatum]|uniref:RNA-binding S4 domain-containing protein n=1 Tax=Prorocentrum cordatum TaxID=2364126 RepID=A0ABN9Q0B9_9DINO|nr:unnamed protein product [Polarella glacialis]
MSDRTQMAADREAFVASWNAALKDTAFTTKILQDTVSTAASQIYSFVQLSSCRSQTRTSVALKSERHEGDLTARSPQTASDTITIEKQFCVFVAKLWQAQLASHSRGAMCKCPAFVLLRRFRCEMRARQHANPEAVYAVLPIDGARRQAADGAKRVRPDGAAGATRPESVTYKVERGLRHIEPYDFDFTTHVKQRWVGRPILEVFAGEFVAYPEEYYRASIEAGRVTVDGRKVSSGHVLQENERIVHRAVRCRENPVLDRGPIRVVAETEETPGNCSSLASRARCRSTPAEPTDSTR